LKKFQYNNTSYRTHSELPAVGSRAPDVSLVNTELQNVSFANWMGKRKILNIFVSIDTEICAKSVIRFDSLAANAEDVSFADGVV
jgi:thiol peroxidase